MALNHMSELRSSDDQHSDDGSTFSYAAHAWQVGRSERSKDGLTQPPDPGRRLRESVRLSFLLLRGDQGPLSGAVA